MAEIVGGAGEGRAVVEAVVDAVEDVEVRDGVDKAGAAARGTKPQLST